VYALTETTLVPVSVATRTADRPIPPPPCGTICEQPQLVSVVFRVDAATGALPGPVGLPSGVTDVRIAPDDVAYAWVWGRRGHG